MASKKLKEWYDFNHAFEEIFDKATARIIELMMELGEYEHMFTETLESSNPKSLSNKGKIVDLTIEGIKIERKFDRYMNISFNVLYVKYSNNILWQRFSYVENFRDVGKIIERLEQELFFKKHDAPIECFKKVHFENEDIIITDPCYVVKRMSFEEEKEIQALIEQEIGKEKQFKDFSKAHKLGLDTENLTHQQILDEYNALCEYEEYFEKYTEEYKKRFSKYDDTQHTLSELGFTDYIENTTYYGDWSCTTFETDENGEVIKDKILGNFCADGGSVAVLKLREVLKYRPDFNYHIEKPWTTTVIENFTGDVWLKKSVVKDGDYTFVILNVIGRGTTNFITKQTGM